MTSSRSHVSRFPGTMGFVCYHAAASIRPGKPREERSSKAPFRVCFELVIELQRELDLPWIVRSITRRSDLAEVRTGKVRRIRNRNYAVAAKSRRVEVRVIQD